MACIAMDLSNMTSPLRNSVSDANLDLPIVWIATLVFHPLQLKGSSSATTRGDECGVFSIHTKTWHRVPLAPELHYPNSVCGMMVDTSERPYTFKFIMGSLERKTQIYDSRSRSWCTTSSVLSQTIQERHDKVGSSSCMCHYGCVYMSLGQEMVLVYSMEEGSWTTLNFLPLNKECNHNTLGVWDGRIFTATGNYKELRVSLWELVDPKEQEWVEYARCAEVSIEKKMKCFVGLETMEWNLTTRMMSMVWTTLTRSM